MILYFERRYLKRLGINAYSLGEIYFHQRIIIYCIIDAQTDADTYIVALLRTKTKAEPYRQGANPLI